MSVNPKEAAKSARVLVVDDESSVLTTYRLILEQQGYAVTASLSSKDAKEAIDKHSFDLVLCDYSLEQQHTGFEVIAAARAKDPQVPSILLTGYATVETTEEARKKQIGVLFKPIDIKEFLTTISSVLRNHNES